MLVENHGFIRTPYFDFGNQLGMNPELKWRFRQETPILILAGTQVETPGLKLRPQGLKLRPQDSS